MVLTVYDVLESRGEIQVVPVSSFSANTSSRHVRGPSPAESGRSSLSEYSLTPLSGVHSSEAYSCIEIFQTSISDGKSSRGLIVPLLQSFGRLFL